MHQSLGTALGVGVGLTLAGLVPMAGQQRSNPPADVANAEDPSQQMSQFYCEYVPEVPAPTPHAVPHHLSGSNTFLTEVTVFFNVLGRRLHSFPCPPG